MASSMLNGGKMKPKNCSFNSSFNIWLVVICFHPFHVCVRACMCVSFVPGA